MSERKIVVPEGMLKAARQSLAGLGVPRLHLETMALAMVHYLAEHPILPTPDQAFKLAQECESSPNVVPLRDALELWQRRMFLAPEPEVPEAIKDLLWKDVPATDEHDDPTSVHNTLILAAYIRGQNSHE